MLSALESKVDGIKSALTVMDSASIASIPLPLVHVLMQTFQCVICLAVIEPPVAYASCCQRLLGCMTCVDQWFKTSRSVLQAQCPHCKSPRGYSKVAEMKGLGDFLRQVRRILQPAGQQGQQQQESQQEEVIEEEGAGPSGSRVPTATQRRANAALARARAQADNPSSSSESEEM